MKGSYDLTLDGVLRRVSISREPGDAPTGVRYRVSVDGGPERLINAIRPVPDVLALLVDLDSWEAGLVQTEEGYEVELLGVRHPVAVADPKRKALRLSAGDAVGVVRTAMPGRVVRTMVAAGESVVKGQPLVVVEAMKMENELKSPRDGVVKRVVVAAGALVESKAVLVELE